MQDLEHHAAAYIMWTNLNRTD